MSDARPAHLYYRACAGRWRAPLSMEIVDPAAVRASGMSALDRWSVRLLAAWPRALGRIFLDTTVAYDPGGEVVHTTVVRWLGIPLRRSVERFTLDPDGRRFTVSGDMIGEGSVDESGSRATYTLRWLGVDFGQRTVRERDRVTVHQEGPGLRAVQVLARR